MITLSSSSSSPSPSTYWKPSPLLLPVTLIFLFLSAQEIDAQQQPPPSNGNCQDATPLTVNGPKVAGTTIAAPIQSLCNGGNWSGPALLIRERPAVWYSFNGTGNIMTFSACSRLTDYDEGIAIKTSCDWSCNVTREHLGLEVKCPTTKRGHVATFDSVKGQTYYAGLDGTDVKFNVSVDDYPGPPNDSCESAEPMTLSIEKPVNASGSTKLAAVSLGCSGSKAYKERFAWYSFLGTGGMVTLSTCSPSTDFFAIPTVQTSCGASECVASYSWGCDSIYGRMVEFLSTEGQKYLVKVGVVGQTGSFVLTLTAAALDTEQSGSNNDEGSSSTNSPSSYDLTSSPSSYDLTLPPLPYCEEAISDCFLNKISPGELASCRDCFLPNMDLFAFEMGCEAATEEFCSSLDLCSSCAPCKSDLEKYMSCLYAMTEMEGITCTFSSCGAILASNTTAADTDDSSYGLSSGAIIGIVVAGVMAALGVFVFLFWLRSKAASGKHQNKDEDLEDGAKPEMTLTGQEEEENHSGQGEAK